MKTIFIVTLTIQKKDRKFKGQFIASAEDEDDALKKIREEFPLEGIKILKVESKQLTNEVVSVGGFKEIK